MLISRFATIQAKTRRCETCVWFGFIWQYLESNLSILIIYLPPGDTTYSGQVWKYIYVLTCPLVRGRILIVYPSVILVLSWYILAVFRNFF